MALYEVERSDLDVNPGEFVSALVIAHGHRQAVALIAHLLPKGATAEAHKVDTRKGRVPAQLLTTYFDEREAEPTAQMFAPDADAEDGWKRLA